MATSCQLDKIVQAGWPEPAAARAAGHAALARPQPPATRTCKREGCDTQFVPRSNAARYCSKACRDIAAARTRRARYQTRRGGSKVYAPATLRCEKCGEIFEPATSEKTCSPRCRAAQQRIARRGGPIRRCVVCGVDYRERDGHRGCCSVKCSEAADADMDWDLLGRGCLLAVLVLLADESRAGGHATSGSVAARLGVSRSNALKHLGTLERCGLAERSMPVDVSTGGTAHEFKSTVAAAAVRRAAPGATPDAVQALVAAREAPPQLGTDLWVLATLWRLLPAGAGLVRRADVAAATRRHTSSVSRSMDRLESAGLIVHQPVPSIPATSAGTAGGVHVSLA